MSFWINSIRTCSPAGEEESQSRWQRSISITYVRAVEWYLVNQHRTWKPWNERMFFSSSTRIFTVDLLCRNRVSDRHAWASTAAAAVTVYACLTGRYSNKYHLFAWDECRAHPRHECWIQRNNGNLCCMRPFSTVLWNVLQRGCGLREWNTTGFQRPQPSSISQYGRLGNHCGLHASLHVAESSSSTDIASIIFSDLSVQTWGRSSVPSLATSTASRIASD